MSILTNIFKNFTGRGQGIQRCIKNAKLGDVNSQYGLGIFYERGTAQHLGIPQDASEASVWYRKAAEQGHAGAQLYLGLLLAQGKGVESNLPEAYKWIALAKNGNVFDRAAAKESLDNLVKYMNEDEILEGQRLLLQATLQK